MLVIKRRIGQRIVIAHPDGDVEVVLLDVETFRAVKVGISAPKSVRILRGELEART